MSTIKVNTITDTSGVEVYAAKAWVNFNGTGTVAIRGSGNISSLVDSNTGTYGITFTSVMPDTNFSLTLAYSNEVNVQHGVGFATARATNSQYVAHHNAANSANLTDKATVAIVINR